MDTDRLDPDLTEALARGREPRKMWPVLHAVEDTTQRPPVVGIVGAGTVGRNLAVPARSARTFAH